jgi:uncharacterized protein (TIGR00730 family)
MSEMRRVCVYCGSRAGTREAYANAARELGTLLGERGIGVVYGGGQVGLMGILADAALAAGGEVIGVIPHALAAREVDHPGVTILHKVETMHERKAMMADLADAFITMPGGIGTLEELTEIWSWAYLGIHHKPVGLLNVAGYYDPLLAFMDGALEDRVRAAGPPGPPASCGVATRTTGQDRGLRAAGADAVGQSGPSIAPTRLQLTDGSPGWCNHSTAPGEG